MPADPLITIVVPTYNRLALLRAALASIAAQTYSNWEAVVVDDGSSDGTADEVRSWADSRVRVLALAHSGHLGRVRNAGVADGSGLLVAFLDSDDLWLPTKLAAQLSAMQEHGARWCYTGFGMMDADGRAIPMQAGVFRPLSGWIAEDLLSMRTGALLSSVLVERGLFDEVGGFSAHPGLTARGDLELVLRLASAAEAVALDQILVRVREHPGRLTATLPAPLERSALAYEIFADGARDSKLTMLARRRRAELLTAAAAQRIARGELLMAAQQLASGVAGGAGLRRAVSALGRGCRAAFRR